MEETVKRIKSKQVTLVEEEEVLWSEGIREEEGV